MTRLLFSCILILVPFSAFSVHRSTIEPIHYSAEQWTKLDFTNLKKSNGKKPNIVVLFLLKQSQRKIERLINQGKLAPDFLLYSQKSDQKKSAIYGTWALIGLSASIGLFALNLFLPFAVLLGLTSILFALIGLKKDSKKTLARVISILGIGLLLFLVVSIATFSLG